MMTEVEIYKKALDGLWADIDYLKGKAARRYGKPGYDEIVAKIDAKRKEFEWLEKKTQDLSEDAPWGEEKFYTMCCNKTTIAIRYEEGEGWEVYYKRPMYPYMFAFGLPAVHTASEVFDVAIANIHNYEDMFD